MAKKKIRPLGDVTQEIEPLWEEFLESHKLQPHEVIGLFLAWQQTHFPSASEVYIADGSSPVFAYYGHTDSVPEGFVLVEPKNKSGAW